MGLEDDMRDLLNKHSAETASDTPDFVLASYLMGCLNAWNDASKLRAEWYQQEWEKHAYNASRIE